MYYNIISFDISMKNHGGDDITNDSNDAMTTTSDDDNVRTYELRLYVVS